MHGNQWVLKIAVLKYYSVSKRGTTAKSNPKQATDPISLPTKFGDNSSNTFPLNEQKPCVTPDAGHRTPDNCLEGQMLQGGLFNWFKMNLVSWCKNQGEVPRGDSLRPLGLSQWELSSR